MKYPASSLNAPEGQRRGRERRCIVNQTSLPETRLVRFALAPDGTVTPDVAAKLPGRGAWVRAERTSIDSAARKGAFARAFKVQARAPGDLAGQVEVLLARRCLELLGLALRAGALAVGAAKTEAAIRAGTAKILIEAADGATEGREKLMALHIGLRGAPPPAVGCFSSEELGVALGRERVIHACLLQERLASGWAAEIVRLAGFRAVVPSSWPDSWRSVGWGMGGADAEPETVGARGGRADA